MRGLARRDEPLLRRPVEELLDEVLLFVALAGIALSAFALLLRRQLLKSHLHPEISV